MADEGDLWEKRDFLLCFAQGALWRPPGPPRTPLTPGMSSLAIHNHPGSLWVLFDPSSKLKEGEDFSAEQFVFQRKQDHGNTFKLQDLYSEKKISELKILEWNIQKWAILNWNKIPLCVLNLTNFIANIQYMSCYLLLCSTLKLM